MSECARLSLTVSPSFYTACPIATDPGRGVCLISPGVNKVSCRGRKKERKSLGERAVGRPKYSILGVYLIKAILHCHLQGSRLGRWRTGGGGWLVYCVEKSHGDGWSCNGFSRLQSIYYCSAGIV